MLFYAPEVILLALWLGWLLDRYWGELSRYHPLVGFGTLANKLEKRLNHTGRLVRETGSDKRSRFVVHQKWTTRRFGLIAWSLLVLPLPLFLLISTGDSSEIPTEISQLDSHIVAGWITLILINALSLYFALGARSLAEHLEWIYQPLCEGNLFQAREKVGWIVSRDTSDMDAHRVARAAIESGLENGSDAIFAPLFWFAVAGAPGVILYRLANTLDAMWGYKTERFLHFGWAAARLDDLLNYLPARLTAAIYCCSGNWHWGIRCWQYQGASWESPNAGPVMAAGAGALRVLLGGGDYYHGHWKERPPLGVANPPKAPDIKRTIELLMTSQWIWLCLLSGITVLYRVLYL